MILDIKLWNAWMSNDIYLNTKIIRENKRRIYIIDIVYIDER